MKFNFESFYYTLMKSEFCAWLSFDCFYFLESTYHLNIPSIYHLENWNKGIRSPGSYVSPFRMFSQSPTVSNLKTIVCVCWELLKWIKGEGWQGFEKEWTLIKTIGSSYSYVVESNLSKGKHYYFRFLLHVDCVLFEKGEKDENKIKLLTSFIYIALLYCVDSLYLKLVFLFTLRDIIEE